MFMNVEKFLDFFDFELQTNDDGSYSVVDTQHANLGNIESEIYESTKDIVERFTNSIYMDDYIYRDLEDEYGYDGDYTIESVYDFAKENDVSYFDIIEAMRYPDKVNPVIKLTFKGKKSFDTKEEAVEFAKTLEGRVNYIQECEYPDMTFYIVDYEEEN